MPSPSTTKAPPSKPDTDEHKGRRDWKTPWLLAYADKGTVKAACKVAKVSRARAYEARKTDTEFAEAWAEAENEVTELLEETSVEKALAGDARMIEFTLKARRPKKYREHSRAEEVATEEIEQGINEAIELQAKEIGRLTDRLAELAPDGEAQVPRGSEGGSLAGTS